VAHDILHAPIIAHTAKVECRQARQQGDETPHALLTLFMFATALMLDEYAGIQALSHRDMHHPQCKASLS
jgi:hypothetical protein